MALIDFLKRADRKDLRLMLLLTLVSGVANALLVLAVNEVTDSVAHAVRPGPLSLAMYAAAFVTYYLGNRYALLRANLVIERLLRQLRLQVMDKLRRSELPVIDRLGRGNLYTLIAQETNHLSLTFPMIIDCAQQAILLTASLLYLTWLSPWALLVFLLAVVLGATGYRLSTRGFRDTAKLITERQADMLDAVADLVHGGKELRLNQRKSDEVFARFRKLSHSTEMLLIISGDHWADLALLGSFVTYLILGVIGFAFPEIIQGHSLVVFQLIPVVLFCMGPLTRIVSQSPLFTRADVGLQSILAINRQLSENGGVGTDEARAMAPRFRDFRRITYSGLTFSHRNASGAAEFTAGPFDLTLTRGETVFLVGGNGSGKSTVTRLLTALYPADAGVIRVDERPVGGRSIAGFRELFSAIFVDFHLFDRLYGLEDVDPDAVNALIEEMGLAGKLRFADGRFTQLALSTGQRKRLALIAALLEDRPIYVFDEWSAEQDVHFREQFYTRILPGLKARGKTVVAVTHDERYWHLADRVIKMDLGRVVWERAGKDLEPA
ncbi:MAG TPA: cyclic peptide export ABC transporter [Azospirillum sp.]